MAEGWAPGKNESGKEQSEVKEDPGSESWTNF